MSFRSCFVCFKKYFLVPFTSLLAIGLTAYISYAYLFVYIPVILRDDGSGYIFALFFLPFPILIYWSEFVILTGDPGRIT